MRTYFVRQDERLIASFQILEVVAGDDFGIPKALQDAGFIVEEETEEEN